MQLFGTEVEYTTGWDDTSDVKWPLRRARVVVGGDEVAVSCPVKPPRYELASVEDGRTTVWRGGHIKSVKVIRSTPGEIPLVECPDCGAHATMERDGHLRCPRVPSCAVGWRTAAVLAADA